MAHLEVFFFDEPPDLAPESISPESVPRPTDTGFFVLSVGVVRFAEPPRRPPWQELLARSPVAHFSATWSGVMPTGFEEIVAKAAERLPGVHLVDSAPDFRHQPNAFELIDRDKFRGYLLAEYPDARALLRRARTMQDDDCAKLGNYLLQLFDDATTHEHRLVVADALVTFEWRAALPRLERENLFSLDRAIDELRKL